MSFLNIIKKKGQVFKTHTAMYGASFAEPWEYQSISSLFLHYASPIFPFQGGFESQDVSNPITTQHSTTTSQWNQLSQTPRGYRELIKPIYIQPGHNEGQSNIRKFWRPVGLHTSAGLRSINNVKAMITKKISHLLRTCKHANLRNSAHSVITITFFLTIM